MDVLKKSIEWQDVMDLMNTSISHLELVDL